MKKTDKELAAILATISEFEGRPTTGTGSLTIERHSPGDGRTRYRVIERLAGGDREDSMTYTRAGLVAYLEGRADGARHAQRAARQMGVCCEFHANGGAPFESCGGDEPPLESGSCPACGKDMDFGDEETCERVCDDCAARCFNNTSPLRCRIQWTDEHGNPTPDENPAIMEARLKEHVQTIIGKDFRVEASAWFPICEKHAAALGDPGMENWETRPLIHAVR